MRLLKGKKIADKILKDLKKAIIKEKLKPGLAVILIGGNKASRIYVDLKKKAAKLVGINFYLYEFKEAEKEAVVIRKIRELNKNSRVHGTIVQLPLPKKFHTQKIINSLDPQKDVDGFHPQNLKAFTSGRGIIFPVLPKAIMKFLELSSRKRAVVLSNSEIFGKIMTATLARKNIKSEYILAGEIKNNLSKIKKADLVISVVGKPGIIQGDMIKKGALVIDGGITKIGKKVLGDTDIASIKNKASAITPVPGGVGPVTIACLLENVYLLSKRKSR